MFLDYQIGLNFASGVESPNAHYMTHESALGTHLNLFYSEWTRANYYIIDALCRIRRTYIHIRNSGRAWQPSPTRRFCIQYRSEHLPISESGEPFCAGGHGGPPLRGGFVTRNPRPKRQRIERSGVFGVGLRHKRPGEEARWE
jgi:hypothetical protein